MTTAHYPLDPASVGRARAFVAGQLSDTSNDMRDRAVLLTSELASNAVIHAQSGFTVTATASADEIHVSVTNAGQTVPTVRNPDHTETHGRGLMIVRTLADRWGIESQTDSTTVWFTLAFGPATVPRPR